MKKQRKFSIAELILYIIVWAGLTALFLSIAIPQIKGELPINGMLLVAECVLLFLSSVMVYELLRNKPKDKDKPFRGGMSM